ncbi:hypothetical protein [Tamlana crocina]|uniref:Uncharacterized protein n=1 Tax=Tamlana crocina TaxID=393006 RepID=A0ABX1DCP1_9FLAO|nr:hypothetical protein [Tamlana crocina]NJX16136.1 hypothetical protein [Tamlana crocina]
MQGIEKLSEGELDAYLNYDKHQQYDNSNIHNGYAYKRIKMALGDTDI